MSVCGDGVIANNEVCDDQNNDNHDGCDEYCKIEDGWECSSDDPSVCKPICGDGRLIAPEVCDDGI